MIKFHPDTNMLAEYVNGRLDWAVSICVAAHLQMCTQCRQEVANLNAIGGFLLSSDENHNSDAEDAKLAAPQNLDTQSVDDSVESEAKSDKFANLMKTIRQSEDNPIVVKKQAPMLANCHARDEALKEIPPIVKKLLPEQEIKWTRISKALKMARLKAGQEKYEMAFHRISSGGQVAEHNHRGLEITMVLHGSFSDSGGIYTPGDFIVKKPGEVHKPRATEDRECLCLSVVEAPVAVTGWVGKLVNPFLKIKPA